MHSRSWSLPCTGLLFCLASDAMAVPASAPLSFEFTGLRSDRGQVVCGLYTAPDDWMKKPWRLTTSSIQGGQATCVFTDVRPGTYALSAYHDENGNHKLDSNFVGMPKEGICASNQAKGFMGPPKWKAAAFVYTGAPVKQHMRYL